MTNLATVPRILLWSPNVQPCYFTGSFRLEQSHWVGLPVPAWLRHPQLSPNGGGSSNSSPVNSLHHTVPQAVQPESGVSAPVAGSGDATAIFTVCVSHWSPAPHGTMLHTHTMTRHLRVARLDCSPATLVFLLPRSFESVLITIMTESRELHRLPASRGGCATLT